MKMAHVVPVTKGGEKSRNSLIMRLRWTQNYYDCRLAGRSQSAP